MKTTTNRLLADFGTASGFFKGDQEARESVRRLSKNQKRKMKRHGIVPAVSLIKYLFQYLARINVIKQSDIPNKPMSSGDLLDFLRFYRYANEGARSIGEYLYREILKSEVPWLAKSFAQGDFIWEGLKEKVNLKAKKCKST